MAIAKNPRYVAMGRASARKRWANYGPRVITMDDLEPAERRLVKALVAAVREQKAATQTETPASTTAEASMPEARDAARSVD